MSRRAGADARAAPLTEADELESALRLFFRVPSSRSRKRARSEPRTEAPESGVEAHLKRIKQVLRDAGAEKQRALTQRVYDVVAVHLGAKDVAPVVLERAIQLSAELFRRSAAFRKIVASQASQFYALLLTAAGEDGEAARARGRATVKGTPSTSPQMEAVLKLIEQWKEDFGARYLPLVTGYDVLVARGYEFPRVRETQAAERERAQRAQSHRRQVHELKNRQRQREMAQFVPEMEALLSEMHQVFEILIPTLDAFQLRDTAVSPPSEEPTPLVADAGLASIPEEYADASVTAAVLDSGALGAAEDDADDIEWESVDPDDEGDASQSGDLSQDGAGFEHDGVPREDMDMNEIVQAYGLGSSSYQLTIEISTSVCERSAENEVLFRTLADGILRLRKRFLPLVRDWLEYAATPESSAASERDRDEWRQLQDLQARLHDVELKWEDLVRESERKRFAHIAPAIVTVPTGAYEPQLPDDPRKRRAPCS